MGHRRREYAAQVHRTVSEHLHTAGAPDAARVAIEGYSAREEERVSAAETPTEELDEFGRPVVQGRTADLLDVE